MVTDHAQQENERVDSSDDPEVTQRPVRRRTPFCASVQFDTLDHNCNVNPRVHTESTCSEFHDFRTSILISASNHDAPTILARLMLPTLG